MTSDVPIDYAVFQLSPRRSRCELFVSYDGTMERVASGFVEPFVTHLKFAEEQVDLAVKSFKLEVDRLKNAEKWFTKGTLERFVQFVGTPEVLEMVNTLDAEMSQLEAARKIYSQGLGDDHSSASGGDGGSSAASDATKKELLRAIDVRLAAVQQDLSTACSRALATGFNPETISELHLFADRFGAFRLSEACNKFMTITLRRADLFKTNQPSSTWKCSSENALRSSVSSDMSIDEPSDDPSKPSAKPTFPLRRFSRDPSPSPVDDKVRESFKSKDIEKDQAATGPTCDSTTESEPSPSPSTSTSTPQLTRRLSVQERISMFENKAQKDNSPSTISVVSGGGKPELRRLSSDVNYSTDKAVLRRWSGASDMSIDVSGEKKENDSNANTPTPTSSSTLHSVFPKDQNDLKAEEGVKESKLPIKSKFGSLTISSGGDSGSEESATSQTNFKITSISGRSTESVGPKDQPSVGVVCQDVTPFGKVKDFGLENRSQPGKTEQSLSSDQKISVEKEKTASSVLQGEDEDDRVRDQRVSRSTFRPSHRKTVEIPSESLTSETQSQPSMLAQPRWRSTGGETEKSTRKDHEKQADTSLPQMETTSSSYKGKFQGHGSSFDQVKKSNVRKEENVTGKFMVENQDVLSSSSVDQGQRVRQVKGNLGVDDDLKMKANELEKLFAEHKLRAPSDQSNSARRTRPVDTPMEQEMASESAGSSSKKEKNNSTPLIKTMDVQDYDVTPKQNVYNLSFSDDSRGKLYQKYMKKRDAKLREDWSSKRAEKEAKMKAMQDSLEKSRAEMKIKLAGSADKRTSGYDSNQRAEKVRSFNVRSTMKREKPVDSFMSDEDEDQAEFLGKKLNETYLGDSSSRSAQSKKVIQNKSTASSTPRNSGMTIPRSSGKSSNSASGKRRLPSDNNPLAQSVPNFSDLRKENTKPYSAGSKGARPQRNHARKKSVSEDLLLVHEEKHRRSNSLKKTIANPIDLNDSRNSDDVDDAIFSPTKHDIEPKSFPRKGNDTNRLKTTPGMEVLGNGHEFDDAGFETEEMTDVPKDEDDYTDIKNMKGRRLSHESDKSANSEFGNSNALGSLTQVGPASAVDLPTSMSSLFRMGSIQDSPGGSPGSWNSRVHNPFSFPHEISDVDASDSPLGSPASWNFHTLNQNDADAARMRKKWGAAQKPIVGDSSHGLSRKDVTKGFKRFLKFGRKNRATESMADWFSVTTSEGDDDTEDGRDLANRSSEDLRKSRMGFSHSQHSDEGFNESDLFNDQVQALQSSIPTPPANFKYREDHLSGSSLKAPKSFFSLSNFRSKGSESKPR